MENNKPKHGYFKGEINIVNWWCTLDASYFKGHSYKIEKCMAKYRIRKLTPRECYRLMDVEEVAIDKLLATDISNTQHYKMAGNSIVVNCLYHIFRQMFTTDRDVVNEPTLF